MDLLHADGSWTSLEAPTDGPLFGISVVDDEINVTGVNGQIWIHDDLQFLLEPTTNEDPVETP
jgi:hypothetical protein